jgi:predicted nucleic acid-binding protein
VKEYKVPEKVAVLRDKNVDLKRLKRLVEAGLIGVYELDLEERPRVGNFVPPMWVLDQTKLDHSVLSSEIDEIRLDAIRSIMGGRLQIADALTLDAAFRNGHLYVVTNDKTDFIRDGKRERLEALVPGVKIVTIDELELALGFEAGRPDT